MSFYAKLTIITILCSAVPLARGESAPDILKATALTGGLIVRVGSTDGELEVRLAELGRGNILVQGLTVSRKAQTASRATASANGKTGLATFALVDDFNALPFNDHVVNLLITDLDLPGAPKLEEVTRVVCPFGTVYVRQGGQWQAIKKPLPKEMDEWTHYDHGPDGNPLRHHRPRRRNRQAAVVHRNCRPGRQHLRRLRPLLLQGWRLHRRWRAQAEQKQSRRLHGCGVHEPTTQHLY